jgi:hypothetical protein
MLKKVLIAAGAAAIAAAGGSLIHPFGAINSPGNKQAILRGARIDGGTLAVISELAKTAIPSLPSGPGIVMSHPSPGCSRTTFNKPACT